MPELMGYRIKDGKLVAVVNFPKARRFTLMPKDNAKTQAQQQPAHEDTKQ